jgi:Tfp pilus assembly protein PilE
MKGRFSRSACVSRAVFGVPPKTVMRGGCCFGPQEVGLRESGDGRSRGTGACAPRGRFARSGSAAQGFALLEIVLAIALFSIVAVGMTRALDQIAQTSKQSRQEAQVLRVLESVLAEVAHQPALKETTVNFPKSADGVDARASIVKVKLVTKDKTELDSMFKVEAEAWLETGFKRSLKRRMETYVYSPHSP